MLEEINGPSDVKRISEDELPLLCSEIRSLLIKTVSENGGHLASNLGVVELTVALHRKFDSPHDSIIFDVGHQCYTHKLLTGRYKDFSTIRTENGISGFTRPTESIHDVFVSGHSSTSVSAGLGIAQANVISGKDGYVVAVIGDGALTGGLAYEGLNNAGKQHNNLIVVLNDNKMSISKNVGAMSRHLAVLRSHPSYFRVKSGIERFLIKIPFIGHWLRDAAFWFKKHLKNLLYNSTIFEDMGFAYIGPIDGHDIQKLEDCLETAKQMKRPALIHICTVKGKGYTYAEKKPGSYHGVASGMDIDTGECIQPCDSFSYQFGKSLCYAADKDGRICAITAAMTDGTGLSEFASRYPDRFFDVGIAEEHALTFASGLAKGGMIPVVALYSSFLQRGYDQLIHDIAVQGLKVIVGVDRAGFVGEDGETHQGLYDISFLSSIPNITVYSPSTYLQLDRDFKEAVSGPNGLYIIRYPRGSEHFVDNGNAFDQDYKLINNGAKSAIVTFGRLSAEAEQASDKLNGLGRLTDVILLNKIRPIPEEVMKAAAGYEKLWFFEEGIKSGGFSEHMTCALYERGFSGKVKITAVDNMFVEHAKTDSLIKRFLLDKEGMVKIVLEDKDV